MDLEPLHDKNLKADIAAEFARFKAMNHYVIRNNKLKRGKLPVTDTAIAEERALLEELQLADKNPEALFIYARQAAFDQRYEEARLIGRHVLRDHPNYHDMRVLVGRTYSWNGDYAEAETYFRDVIRRNPLYADAYSALADAERWNGQLKQSLQVIEQGLAQVPEDAALLLQKAKTLSQLERPQAALQAVNASLRTDPDNDEARELRERLASGSPASEN